MVGLNMVKNAMVLPKRVVENVAHRHGEVSIEVVESAYSKSELKSLRREAREGDGAVVVVAQLEPVERERVEEAAEAEGKHPSVWLAEAAVRVVRGGGPVARPQVVGDQVERAIYRETEV